jgi:hypothetical protein
VEKGQVQFAGTARRVLRTNWACPLFPQDACRAFPDPQDDGLASGPDRNFQILDPLEFLAEFTRPGVPDTPFRRRART